MARKQPSNDTIAVNRRARFDYTISDTYECGMVLQGTEVKSLRAGKASIAQAFATVRGGELWLYMAEIAEYEFGNINNHEPQRRRKLLAHKHEIKQMTDFTQEQGRTLVPMKLYWKDGRAKVLIGTGVGKSTVDKRQDQAKKDAKREVERALKARSR
ncbi:SsrA-binding protein SmpB [Euzebya tangerina]|uniref:SsrA-binding protein SmpB n=1 Tax=Euzebya tangerina TaxID=591198 RepID=UPI000E30EA8C|nr:SsrA-binding protein SmpB [Euzebya tangerina]